MTGLERLHFTNGRLLDAADLRLEQHYHIAIRRLLNRGLFTPGVVNGLEVTKTDTRTVTVKAGLALDPQGRELFLGDEVDVAVPNQPPLNRDRAGYFLTLRYDEESVPGSAHPCAANGAAPEPARIREEPLAEWSEDWPNPALCGKPNGRPLDCAIVIALVTLDSSCQIAAIETAFRQYAYPAHLSQVQALALEGEKDIDVANPKVLRFQVRGGSPSAVVLYLWGDRFSSLHYTEMGTHTHALTALALAGSRVDLGSHTHQLGDHTHPIGHTHSVSLSAGTSGVNNHRHALKVEESHGYRVATSSAWFDPYVFVDQPGNSVPYLSDAGAHSHSVSLAFTTAASDATNSGGPSNNTSGGPSTNESANQHTHQLSSATLSPAGNGPPLRQGAAYDWLEGLRVELDSVDITSELLTRFLMGWGQLGNATAGHPLNSPGGTGPLELLSLGRRIDQGPHTIRLSVPKGGGKVLYNLYVS